MSIWTGSTQIRALAATEPHPHPDRPLQARHPDTRHDQTLIRAHAASVAVVAAPSVRCDL